MKSGNNKQQRKQFEGGGKSRDGNNMKAKEENVSEESGQLAQMPPRGPVREPMWLSWVLTRRQSWMTLTQLSRKEKLD